jgi:hypothetical protein
VLVRLCMQHHRPGFIARKAALERVLPDWNREACGAGVMCDS